MTSWHGLRTVCSQCDVFVFVPHVKYVISRSCCGQRWWCELRQGFTSPSQGSGVTPWWCFALLYVDLHGKAVRIGRLACFSGITLMHSVRVPSTRNFSYGCSVTHWNCTICWGDVIHVLLIRIAADAITMLCLLTALLIPWSYLQWDIDAAQEVVLTTALPRWLGDLLEEAP